jgi:TatA/E family protein of Tat protein translocase
VVALVLFGGDKLPELGRGLGAGLRGFKDGIKGLADELREDLGQRAGSVGIETRTSDSTLAEAAPSAPIAYNFFKFRKVNILHCAAVNGPRIALQSVRGSSRKQSPRKEQMVDIILLLMAIASATSLLVVSPRDLQRKAILTLRECEEMERSRAPMVMAKMDKPRQSQ